VEGSLTGRGKPYRQRERERTVQNRGREGTVSSLIKVERRSFRRHIVGNC